MFDLLPARWAPYLRSILRFVAAFLFMAHGSQKLFVFPAAEPQTAVTLGSLPSFGGIFELFGGALLLLGLFARPVAFLLAGEMAFAYFRFHAPGGFWPIINKGELAVLYCFTWLYLAAAGPGPWSLDGWLRTPRRLPR